jgi:ABC-type transporter MlaC component
MITIKYIPTQIQNKIEKLFSYLEKEQIEITSEPNGLCIIINEKKYNIQDFQYNNNIPINKFPISNDEIDDVKLCLVE